MGFKWEIIIEWINNICDFMGLFSVYVYVYMDVYVCIWIYILIMFIERV